MGKPKSSNNNTDKTLNNPACSTKTDRDQASALGSMQTQLTGKQAAKKGKHIDKQDTTDEKTDDKPKKKQREPWNNRRSTIKRHAPCEEADAPQTQTQDAHAKSLDQAPAVASPGYHETPKQTDREAMMRYLVKNHRPVECDVRVECSPYTWMLHRQILEQCPYFAFLFPPKEQSNKRTEPNEPEIDNPKDMDVINLHGHVPEQLANVFYYMYFYTYPGADCDPSDPLVANCVLTNTAMYIAGASVGYQDMMCHAVRKIDEWSAAADSCIKALKDALKDKDLDSLADPLWRSLCIVYEQPLDVREGLLVALRVALVRVVNDMLPFLAANTSFRTHYREWTRPVLSGADADVQKTLAETVLLDHALFQDLGMLRLDKPAMAMNAEVQKKEAKTNEKHEKQEKQEKASIAYLFHLLNRLSNIELWSSHASTSANANTTPKATIAATPTAKGGDDRGDREGRGDGGDHRDWLLRRQHLDKAMREHALIVRQLDDCLL